MGEFETISYDQALGIVRRHADKEVALVTAPFPGMSMQCSGRLFVQDAEQFAFAVAAGEHLSFSVVPFPNCVYQIPSGAGELDALICAVPGPEPEQEIMMWMLRFD